METFAPPRELIADPHYERDRRRGLQHLDLLKIDSPIRDLIAGFATLTHIFTLQCCYGHFVHSEQPEPDNLEPLPERDAGPVTYRIAYLALCLENSRQGRCLRDALAEIPAVDPDFVQFGSPGWFWERHPNSFALQVEPARFADRDQAIIDHSEALHVQEVRDRFFGRLSDLGRPSVTE